MENWKTQLGNITWKHVIILKHQYLRGNVTSIGNRSWSYEKYKVLIPKVYGHFEIKVLRKLCFLSAENIWPVKFSLSFEPSKHIISAKRPYTFNLDRILYDSVFQVFSDASKWMRMCRQNPIIWHMRYGSVICWSRVSVDLWYGNPCLFCGAVNLILLNKGVF